MVPKGWTETYLGEVITHKKGFAFNSGSYRDKGIRIVRISDTTRNSVHSENPVYLAEEDANGEIEIQAYSFTENEDGTEGDLQPIPEDSDAEWDMIEEVFNSFIDEN